MQKSATYLVLALLTCLPLSACQSTKKTPLHKDDFGNADMFTYSVPGNNKSACEAARRAILSQGYIIAEANESNVRARRKFQSDEETHVEIEFNIVCASNSRGSNSATIFANAVKDRYSLKKSSSSASLGVGGLGSISLPFGESNESMVKVASETISDAKLYARYFELVERYLDDVNEEPETTVPNTAAENKP